MGKDVQGLMITFDSSKFSAVGMLKKVWVSDGRSGFRDHEICVRDPLDAALFVIGEDERLIHDYSPLLLLLKTVAWH